MPDLIPTELTPESIERFRKIYKSNFGEDISPEMAKEEGLRLLRLLVALLENLPLDLDEEQMDNTGGG